MERKHLGVLIQRRDYLERRIAAKADMPHPFTREPAPYDTDYDEGERAALAWAIDLIQGELAQESWR